MTSQTPTADADQVWQPIAVMPSVQLQESVETSRAAMVPLNDARLSKFAAAHPSVERFLEKFYDEFGQEVEPTVVMILDRPGGRSLPGEAIRALRDALCISAVIASHCHNLKRTFVAGTPFSDAFEFYPWFVGRDYDDHIYTTTPALMGMHSVEELHAQPFPAFGNRILTPAMIDEVLLEALLEQWERRFGQGMDEPRSRRLFRSLDMARTAARMPGGIDASLFDQGRALALWASAYEILSYETFSHISRVLECLRSVRWLLPAMQAQDRSAKVGSKRQDTNLAGQICSEIYTARNDFFHGNAVDSGTVMFEGTSHLLTGFASPLFRMLLADHLQLYVDVDEQERSAEESAALLVRMHEVRAAQRASEEALMMALKPAVDG